MTEEPGQQGQHLQWEGHTVLQFRRSVLPKGYHHANSSSTRWSQLLVCAGICTYLQMVLDGKSIFLKPIGQLYFVLLVFTCILI